MTPDYIPGEDEDAPLDRRGVKFTRDPRFKPHHPKPVEPSATELASAFPAGIDFPAVGVAEPQATIDEERDNVESFILRCQAVYEAADGVADRYVEGGSWAPLAANWIEWAEENHGYTERMEEALREAESVLGL